MTRMRHAIETCHCPSSRVAPDTDSLHRHAPASVQASSPSAQDKAVAAQIGDRDRNWREKVLCSTIGVVFGVQHALYPKVLSLIGVEASSFSNFGFTV